MQKRNARRNLRRVKREGGDATAAQKALMTAVRMHNDALRSIRQARNERKRLDECRRFLSDPNAFAKKLLNPPVEAKAAFAKEVADDYFKKTYSDPNRSFCYTPPPDLPRPKLPEHPFDTKFATFEEFSRICRKKSNGSAPGPNGIPYLLYKCCPKVRKVLWSLLNRVWMEKCIPTEFQVGRVRLLPKSTDTSHPKLMRPISILNSEGRLFWTVFQLRMSRYMISNKYIQPHVQKGFIEGVAGCIEHTTTHWEMLQDAKKRRRIIVLAWLDLENAYGSIRHMLVQFAMKWYYVPQRICDLLFRYYEDIFLRVVTDNWTSDYFHLAIGVPQGCTASTIMFDVAFQVVIDIWRWKTRDISPGYTIKGANICISCPTYADDVELVASDVKECQGSIDCFQFALAWSKTLKAKPEKCRSLAFRLFRKDEKTPFKKVLDEWYSSFDPLLQINNCAIKFIGDDDPPIFKYLGRYLQHNLKEDIIAAQIDSKLQQWLTLVDESAIEGRMKAWIVNFHVCSKLAWWLMVQNFGATTVRKWQQRINALYRKWLGLAQPAEPSVLFRSNEHFGLNLKDLVEMWRQTRVVKWHIMKYAKDPQTRKVYDHRLGLDQKGHIGKGNITSPALTIERIERSLDFERIIGAGQLGRTGLGFQRVSKKLRPREHIVARMKQEAEENRMVLLHDYQMQTNWLHWGLDGMMKKDLSWQAMLYQYSQRLLKFLINAQSNTLPSPDNLRRWKLNRSAACGLCGSEAATLTHILAGCPWVRDSENKVCREDRYTWRHNNLVALVASELNDHIQRANKLEKKSARHLIQFVPAGTKPRHRYQPDASCGWLGDANDWVADWDLPEFHSNASSYVFPHYICASPLKVDGFIVSNSSKVCIILEFTSPMEDNLDMWNTRKKVKYSELEMEARKNGWTIRSVFIEVGARGWVPQRVFAGLRSLGLAALAARRLCKRLSYLALKSSYIIWINRFNKEFHPWRLKDQDQKGGDAGLAKAEKKALDHVAEKQVVNSTLLREGKRRANNVSLPEDGPVSNGGLSDVPPNSYAMLKDLVHGMQKNLDEKARSLLPQPSELCQEIGNGDRLSEPPQPAERDESFDKIMKLLAKPHLPPLRFTDS